MLRIFYAQVSSSCCVVLFVLICPSSSFASSVYHIDGCSAKKKQNIDVIFSLRLELYIKKYKRGSSTDVLTSTSEIKEH